MNAGITAGKGTGVAKAGTAGAAGSTGGTGGKSAGPASEAAPANACNGEGKNDADDSAADTRKPPAWFIKPESPESGEAGIAADAFGCTGTFIGCRACMCTAFRGAVTGISLVAFCNFLRATSCCLKTLSSHAQASMTPSKSFLSISTCCCMVAFTRWPRQTSDSLTISCTSFFSRGAFLTFRS